jgi:broad specificity phosphatase PhoE
VPLLVVRHARAEKRREWEGDDRLRPLDAKGRRQAAGLPGLLARFEITGIASSSYLRCTQTVEPLSEQRGLPIEERRELEEGAALEETLALLRELGDEAVFCTHGDVLENLFGEAGQKGSTRVVELRDGEPIVLEYLPPPA